MFYHIIISPLLCQAFCLVHLSLMRRCRPPQRSHLFCLHKRAVTLGPGPCVTPFMPQHALLKCYGVIACFLFAFHQKLGHSFVDIKTYCRPAFAWGQCQFWWESEGKGKRGMFVCLPAIGACSDCERPLPLLGNIIHQGGLRPDTGEDCLYTLSLSLAVPIHIPFCAGISCWMLSNFQVLLNLCVGWRVHTSHYCYDAKHKLSASWLPCLNSLIDSFIFW